LCSRRCSGLILYRSRRHLGRIAKDHHSVASREKKNMAAVSMTPETSDLSYKRQRLIEIIRRQSLLRNRDFVLTSGRSSNFFFDMKRTMFDPEGASLIADLLFEAMRKDDVDCIGGLETGAIPIVAALCARSWPEKPMRGFFVRKEAKGHGTDQRIDGLLERGSRIILFEDVTTTGGSVMQAVIQARQFECVVSRVITVVDRLEGAAENFRAADIEFEALFTWRDFS
jgi:orotate phosphoribosyltransferase